jgi:hypothetical protein
MKPASGLVAVAALALALAGCAEVSTSSSKTYVPATVESTSPDGPKRVTFTEEAAKRVDLATGVVRAARKGTVVDYAALIYDKTGKSWVFAVVGPLSFQRAAVTVDEIKGASVILSAGPRAGTRVVTVGAIEVWGAELGIAGKH